jgi:hypothetical protein
MRMNMSHFKKVSEDANTAVLKHPNGHEIRVAKKGLSKKLSNDLSKLPIHLEEGGQIQELDPQSPAQMQSEEPKRNPWEDAQSSSQQPSSPQQAYELAKQDLSKDPNGLFGVMPPGLPLPPEDKRGDLIESAALQKAKEFNQVKGQEQVSDRKDLFQTQAAIKQYEQAGVQPPQDLVAKQAELQGKEGAVPPAPTNYNLASLQLSPDKGAEQPQQPSAQMPNMMSSALMPAMNYEQGMMNEARAAQSQGNAIALAAKQQQADMNSAKQWYQNRYDALDAERNALRKDISANHVDPNRYISNMSTGAKVVNAFAMVLGGMGAALTHGQNPAMEFLKSSIDNDIKAQQFNMDKKNNLLSENLRQFGNLKDATDMTRLMTGEMYLSKMRQAEGEAMGPLAKARMQQAAAKFEMEYMVPLQQQMAMRQGLMAGHQNGQVNPAFLITYSGMIPKEQQGEALKQLKEQQELQATKQRVLDAMQQVYKLNSGGNRFTSPIRSRNEINGILEPIKLELARKLAGRVSEYELNSMAKALNNFTDDPKSLQTKMDQISGIFDSQMHFPLLDMAGITPQKQMPKPMQMQIGNPAAYQQVKYNKR